MIYYALRIDGEVTIAIRWKPGPAPTIFDFPIANISNESRYDIYLANVELLGHSSTYFDRKDPEAPPMRWKRTL